MTQYNVDVKYNVDSSGLKNVEKQFSGIKSTINQIGSDLNNKLNSQLGKINTSTSELASGLSNAKALALGVSAAFTAAAAGAAILVKALGDAQVINDLAEKTGIAAAELNVLRGAAKGADANFAAVTSSFEQFSTTLASAQAGKKKALEQFDAIGVSVKALSKLNPSEALFITTQAINSIDDYAVRQKALQSILGSTGAELIKIANEYDTLADAQAKTQNNQFSEQFLNSAQEYDDLVKRLKISADELYVSFANTFGPPLVKLLLELEGPLNSIVNLIGSELSKAVKDTTDFMSSTKQEWNAITGAINKAVEASMRFATFASGTEYFGNVTSGSASTTNMFDNVRSGSSFRNARQTNGGGSGDKAGDTASKELSRILAENRKNEAEYTRELLKDEAELSKIRQTELKAFDEYSKMQLTLTNSLSLAKDYQAVLDSDGLAAAQRLLEADERRLFIEEAKKLAKEAGITFDQASLELQLKELDATKLSIAFRKKSLQQFEEGLQNLNNQFADFFTDTLTGGKADFGAFLADLGKQMLNSGLKEIFQSLFSTSSTGGGGGGTSNWIGLLVSAFAGGAKTGGAFNNGYQFFANGGVVNRSTPFGMAGGKTGVMGEAGPEAILPLSRMSNGKLGVAAGGGGGRNISIQNNVTVTGDSSDPDATARATSKALNDLMEIKVRKIIADERRVGNSMNPTKQIV